MSLRQRSSSVRTSSRHLESRRVLIQSRQTYSGCSATDRNRRNGQDVIRGSSPISAVVASDLEGIRAPAQVRPRHGDPAVVTTLAPARMALEQEAMLLHHADVVG